MASETCRLIGEADGIIAARCGDWNVLCNAEKREYLALVPRIIRFEKLNLIQEYKHSYRDTVQQIQPLQERVVLKYSRREHAILAKHLMTLIKDSEAFAALKRAIRLRRAGIHEVYQPILAIERRVHGMVRETFFLYSFVDGVDCAHCDERLLPMVLDALRKIHRAGCRHADAKPENFLVENGRIVMIDSRFKRNILGRVGELFDFITLEDNLPAARRFNQFNRRSPAYLIPRIYRTIKLNKTVRRFKRMLRDRRARIFGAPPRETKGVA